MCIRDRSGCGKSITALSVLGLLSPNGRVTQGDILYQGQSLLHMREKQLDAIRGREIAMIFQDILYSLNPVFTIGSQLTEVIRRHLHEGQKQANTRAEELLEKTGIVQPQTEMHKYPPSAFRRHAPARDDRHGARVPAEAAHRR